MNNQTTVTENYRGLPISADRLSENLNEKQLAAIEMLLSGKSLASVANAIGICAKTLYNWRQDELFIEALENRRREMWTQAAERLRAMVHPSLDIVERELKNPYDRARWRAATAVLRLADLRKTVLNDQSQ